jgi:glycosyltransferase involved in cell wall biosynthesis
VIIRCHQQGRFLREAVESVNAQTHLPDLIVVVDDGSIDETGEVLASLADNVVPISTVVRSPARGAVASLNDGIAAAEGCDLLCPLDADDRLSSRFLELTSAALATDPGAGLAYGEVRAFGAETWIEPAAPFELDHLMTGNYVPITALLRRRVYDELGPFDERFDRTGFEDWEFWTRAAAAGVRGVPVEGCWLEYRRTATGSRNEMSFKRSLRARGIIWSRHWRALRPHHLTRWLRTEAGRRVRGSR